MKKFFSFIISLILCSLVITLSGCIHITFGDFSGIGEPPEVEEFETKYSYNETHHWFQQIGGSEQKDKEEHVNDSGRCVCGMYYENPNLMFRYVSSYGGYEVYGFDEFVNPISLHVQIPEFYQGEGDDEPIKVIGIAPYAFCGDAENSNNKYCKVKIKSVQIPDSVKYIGRNAFAYSDIEELIIPDSVTNDLEYTAMYCSSLKRVVVGDGVTLISKYAFCNSNLLEEIVLGSSVREIRQRNFIGNPQLKRIVLPASLVSIPESSYSQGNAAGIEPQINLFKNSGSPAIFLEITKEQLDALTIPQKTRDLTGKIIAPSSSALTTYGYVDGWSGSSKIYYVGEWHYEDGKPVPDVQK